ncbi:MAG TPA: hypothetical protein VFZ58_03160 [Candidatus Saccharimonadales bacterium]
MINAAQPRKGPEDYSDHSRGNIHGDLRWPTVDSDDNNPNTGTQHVQLPIVERGPQKESKKKRHLIVGAVAAVTLGVIGGGSYALGKQGGGDRNPGEIVNPETHNSASQTPGTETSEQVVTTSPNVDIVTGEPDPSESFTLPPRPEELNKIPALEQGKLTVTYTDVFLSEPLSSEMTFEGRKSSFKGTFLGGEWKLYKSKGPSDTTPDSEKLPTYTYKDDKGVAARTHLTPILDFMRECEDENNDKPCAYKTKVTRPDGGAPYPTYVRLTDPTGQIPDQQARIRQTVTVGATIEISGYDKKTGEPIVSTTIPDLPLADIHFKDSQNKEHTLWISPPVDSD